MSNKALVRNGRHQRGMLAVLDRANLGEKDTYGRGRWITKDDLPAILQAIRTHPRSVQVSANAWCCPGTNMHNYVYQSSFEELFE